MKTLIFFTLITGNTLLAADFNYSLFAGKFNSAESSSFCAYTEDVSFAGSKMITVGGCVGQEPFMRIYVCENENNLPKCTIDQSLPQGDACMSSTLQFLATGDYLYANRCRGVTFLYKRATPLSTSPVASDSSTSPQPEQPAQPESNDGRFD